MVITPPTIFRLLISTISVPQLSPMFPYLLPLLRAITPTPTSILPSIFCGRPPAPDPPSLSTISSGLRIEASKYRCFWFLLQLARPSTIGHPSWILQLVNPTHSRFIDRRIRKQCSYWKKPRMADRKRIEIVIKGPQSNFRRNKIETIVFVNEKREPCH